MFLNHQVNISSLPPVTLIAFPFSNGTVNLSWVSLTGNACSRAVLYTVFISGISPFTINGTKECTVNLADGMYDWNVTTFNGEYGVSDRGSFRVCTVSAPRCKITHLFFKFGSALQIVYPEDRTVSVVPVTLTWTASTFGKACNAVHQAAVYLYLSIVNDIDNHDIPYSLAAILSTDTTSWPVPDSYGEGL